MIKNKAMLSEQQQHLIDTEMLYTYITQEDSAVQKSIFNEFGQEPFSLQKTGKEVKEKLVQLINHYKTSKQLKYDCMVEAKEQCPGEPIEEPHRMLLQGFESKISPLPKLYSWEQCCSIGAYHYEVASSNPFTTIQESEDTPKMTSRQCCECYNECVRCYIRCCIECCKLQTLHDNLSDNQTMKLSVKQASILGF